MDFNEFRNKLMVLGLIVLLGFFLLVLDSIGIAEGVYSLAATVSNPLRLEGKDIVNGVNDTLKAFSRINEIQNENSLLKSENNELREGVVNCDLDKKRFEELKKQFKASEDFDFIKEGRVIGIDEILSKSLQINLGTREGLEKADIVIKDRYVIGEIIELKSKSADVLLISSPSVDIPVKGSENGAKGLIIGGTGTQLEMIDILPEEEIVEGEIILTSGINSKYPADLIIGEVAQISTNVSQAEKNAKVNRLIDFSDLDYIYVIKGQLNK